MTTRPLRLEPADALPLLLGGARAKKNSNALELHCCFLERYEVRMRAYGATPTVAGGSLRCGPTRL